MQFDFYKARRSGIGTAAIVLILTGIILSPDGAASQSLTDGSIYSRFGIGERTSYFSAKSQALGGGGLALSGTRYANFSNPATLGDLLFTRLSGGMTYEGIKESADNAESSRLASGYLNALQVSFPLKAGRSGIGISFTPYSRMSYHVDNTGTLVTDPDNGTVESFTTSFFGNGGLQEIGTGFGISLTNNLRVGISTRFIFGILQESQSTRFDNLRFRDATITKSTRLSGVTGTFGVRWAKLGVLGNNDAISVGAVYTLPGSLSGNRVTTLGEGQDADTLGASVRGSLDLPASFGLGIAYQPSPKWTVVTDAQFEQWSEFSSDFALPGYIPGDASGFSDRLRLSAGVEFFPGARNLFASFFERIAYRLGIYSDQSYVSPDPNVEINTFGVTGGISLPTKVPGTSIDINLDIGRRGTTGNGLIRDRFIRLGVNLNFGERWFNRSKLG